MHVIVPLIFPCSVQILLENASIGLLYLTQLSGRRIFPGKQGISFLSFLFGFFCFVFSFFVSFFFSFFLFGFFSFCSYYWPFTKSGLCEVL